MKLIALILIFSSSLSFAKNSLSMKEFDDMSFEQQVQALNAYREFLKTYSDKMEAGNFSFIRISPFAEAWAAGDFDCFYAGWPSKSSSKPGGGRLCRSPMKGNPNYPASASRCGSNLLLCQPAIFGSGFCVNVGTAAQRNSAFQQCEQKFRDANRSAADVVRELNTPEKRADFQELMQVSERVCRDGFQPAICIKLQSKLSAIKETGGATLVSAVRTAVEVTTDGVNPTLVDCDPNTPGIQTVPPARPVTVPMARIFKRYCGVPRISSLTPAPANVRDQMAAENISIVAGEVTDNRILSNFMNEFNKFPATLRDEMKRNGSRINLIVGNGVSEDPSWAAEAARAANPNDYLNTHDGRPWNQVPGSGGSMGASPTPTRIVVNRLYEGHGASNLFLHEYGHTLDSMYGENAITASTPWKLALERDSRSQEFVQAICGSYCNDTEHKEEAFAELFAYFQACPETNSQLRQLLPNVANFFDKLTNVREMIDGRIPLGDPILATIAPVVAVAGGGNAIVVGTAVGNASIGDGPLSRAAVVPPQTGVESITPQVIPGVAGRVPQGVAVTGGVITPNRILQLISVGELTYLGRGLLPGSDTVGSCVFKNAQVYVIVHACRRDGREAPATNIDVITNDGQKINYYIENSQMTDETVGMPSQVRRQSYDRAWRITYQRPGPPPTPYSLGSMRVYLQNVSIGDACYTGGMMVGDSNDTSSRCRGSLQQNLSSWQPEADQFFTEPGDAWYNFLRGMRRKVQSSAGR